MTSEEMGNAALGSSWEGGMRGHLPGDPVPLVFSVWLLVEMKLVG